MTSVYFVIEILISFIDIYILWKVGELFFDKKEGKTYIYCVVPYFICVIKTVLDYKQITGIWSGIFLFLYFAGQFIYLVMAFEGAVLTKGIVTSAVCFLELLSEVIIMIVGIPLFDLKIQKLQEHGLENIICLLVAKGICIFFLWITKRIRQANWKLMPDVLKSLGFLMAVNMLFVMVIYVLYRNITVVTKEILFLVTGSMLFFIAILNVVVFYNMMSVSEKNYQAFLQIQYMQAQEQQNQNMETVVQNLRQLRHDMNNHMGVLYGLCDTKQYDALRQYLQGIMQMTKEADDIIVVANQPVLSIVLNNKYTLAKEKGIRFTYATQRDTDNTAGKTGDVLLLSEMEQCSLFGNILDNAIEACEKIPEAAQRWIHLTLGKKENGWLIVCKNSYLEKPIFQGNELITKKEDARNHGIGTRTMRSIIKKYNGALEYQVTEEVFQIKIFLQALR